MATPHVAGYAAYLLGLDSSLSPDAVASSIGRGALSGALGQIREFFLFMLHSLFLDAEFGVTCSLRYR